MLLFADLDIRSEAGEDKPLKDIAQSSKQQTKHTRIQFRTGQLRTIIITLAWKLSLGAENPALVAGPGDVCVEQTPTFMTITTASNERLPLFTVLIKYYLL